MTQSAELLVILVVSAPSPHTAGFQELHYHRFVDLLPDLAFSSEMIDQYRELEGATIDITHLPYEPGPIATHPGPSMIQ